jgi:hypothetical protein
MSSKISGSLKEMINKVEFEQIIPIENMKDELKEVFEVDMDISGGWGYDHNTAIVVHSLKSSLEQFVHTFASIRANIEMNLTLDEDSRYGGINVNFEESKKFEIENRVFDVLTFKITAMKEKDYAEFIAEYKENYGKKEFDMQEHFNRRKEATITRVVDFWFLGLDEVSNA